MYKKPKEILSSTTKEVQKLVSDIIALEKEYQHIQNIEGSGKSKEITNHIIKLIEREVS
jgi:hypothetical protein